jgi:hypothetical protein
MKAKERLTLMSNIMMSSRWRCPYCPATGTEDVNRAAFDRLIKHLQDSHLEEAFAAVTAKLDKREFVASRLGRQVVTPYIKYVADSASSTGDNTEAAEELPALPDIALPAPVKLLGE